MINSPDININNSLEDRHFLSDPRPVSNLDLPSWEVDVYREGVDQPIMTLLVDAKVLPPRKKKKKTLWRLPDSIETNPKFGELDKRRILELFREKKKELKKLKNKQRAYRRASSIEAMNGDGRKSDSGGGGGSGSGSNKPNPVNGASPTPKNLPPENRRYSKVSNDARDDSSLSPPGFGKLSISEAGNTSTTSMPPAPPPGIHSFSPLKPAPPGLPSKNQQQIMNGHKNPNYQNGFSTSNSSTSQALPPPGLYQNGQKNLAQISQQPSLSPSPPPPGLVNGHHHPRKHETPPSLPPRAIGPCFVLPPEAPPGASMGKYVTETYYLLLRNGLVRELHAYYYKKSSESDNDLVVHKALTVGGAHAVCATPQDRLVQLQTFAGWEMRIKGVQQQPTVGKGILVLITGVNIRSTIATPTPGSNGQAQQQQQQQQLLPFCHTLILTPVSTLGANPGTAATMTPTIGYQILNDNLVILTADE
jgi:hypothetical protein